MNSGVPLSRGCEGGPQQAPAGAAPRTRVLMLSMASWHTGKGMCVRDHWHVAWPSLWGVAVPRWRCSSRASSARRHCCGSHVRSACDRHRWGRSAWSGLGGWRPPPELSTVALCCSASRRTGARALSCRAVPHWWVGLRLVHHHHPGRSVSTSNPGVCQVYDHHQLRTRLQGLGNGTKSIHAKRQPRAFFQCTAPVFGISAREMLVSIKEIRGLFDEISHIQTAKKCAAVGIQMAVGFLFLVF